MSTLCQLYLNMYHFNTPNFCFLKLSLAFIHFEFLYSKYGLGFIRLNLDLVPNLRIEPQFLIEKSVKFKFYSVQQ